MPPAPPEVIAVDVGNSRVKLGRFHRIAGLSLPEPSEVFELPITERTTGQSGRINASHLDAWCNEHVADGAAWRVASVHRIVAERLVSAVTDWAARSRFRCPIQHLTYRNVPLEIRVEEPARVGIDRLVAAVAADRFRQRDRPAIIVDLGTAITVDLLEADGSFAGGTILPGIAISAWALSEQTDALPQISLERLETPPSVPGKSTTAAIEAGLYWGAVGAIREIISQLSTGLTAPPEVFLTGGASPQVAKLLAKNANWSVRHVPHLVLSGIALVET